MLVFKNLEFFVYYSVFFFQKLRISIHNFGISVKYFRKIEKLQIDPKFQHDDL